MIGAVRTSELEGTGGAHTGGFFVLEFQSEDAARAGQTPQAVVRGTSRRGTADGWELEVLPFETGAETRAVALGLALGVFGEGSGTVWYDELILVEEVASPLPGRWRPTDWAGSFSGLTLDSYLDFRDAIEIHDLAFMASQGVDERELLEVGSVLDGDRRTALLALPGTTLTSEVEIPDEAALRFSYGVAELAWGRPGDGTFFRVRVDDGNDSEAVFESYLNPKHNERDRAWKTADVDLSAWAGRRVRVRFEVEGGYPRHGGQQRPLDARFDYGLFAEPRIVQPGMAPEKPHVLIIALDTLRADRLGSYGGPNGISPALDGMADAGVRFSRTYAPAAYTLPSFASLFTSRSPLTHGAKEGSGMRAGFPTLAGELRDAGYHTVGIHEGGYLTPELGLGRGFDRYSYVSGGISHGVDRTLDTLRSAGGQPTFVFFHTYHLHAPYREMPDRIAEVWPSYRAWRDRFFTADQISRLTANERLSAINASGESVPPVVSRLLRRLYDGLVRDADEHVARLLAGLKDGELERDTIVVVLSDHGEGFQEHGLFLHGNTLFNELLYVPLIVRWPGRLPAGRVVDGFASLVDVMPTILDLVDVEPTGDLEGRSLLGYLEGGDREPGAGGAPPDRAFVAANLTPRDTQVAMVKDGLKLVVEQEARSVRLFDQLYDPGEKMDLVTAEPELTGQLVAELGKILARAPGYHLVVRGDGEQSEYALRVEADGRLGQVRGLFLEPQDRIDISPGQPAGVLDLVEADGWDWIWIEGLETPHLRVTRGEQAVDLVRLDLEALEADVRLPRVGPWVSSGVFLWEGRALGEAGLGLVTPESLERLRELGYIR